MIISRDINDLNFVIDTILPKVIEFYNSQNPKPFSSKESEYFLSTGHQNIICKMMIRSRNIEELKFVTEKIVKKVIEFQKSQEYHFLGIMQRDYIIDRIIESKNIETRPMLPLLNQPIYKKIFGSELENEYPVAKYINNNGFYIGCHHGMSNEDVDYITKQIIAFVNK